MLEGASVPQPKPYAIYGEPLEAGAPKFVLSILICHLENRKLLLERLLACLKPQIGYKADEYIGERYFESVDGKVQIIVEGDNGKITTGEKRNKLLEKSSAENVAMADDDDLLNPRYIELILEALKTKSDCVSLNGLMYRDGHSTRKFSHSLKNGPEWRQNAQGVYMRGPNHLNTVRRELALQAGYDKITIGEDKSYAMRLFPLLKVEAEVIPELYYYYA